MLIREYANNFLGHFAPGRPIRYVFSRGFSFGDYLCQNSVEKLRNVWRKVCQLIVRKKYVFKAALVIKVHNFYNLNRSFEFATKSRSESFS